MFTACLTFQFSNSSVTIHLLDRKSLEINEYWFTTTVQSYSVRMNIYRVNIDKLYTLSKSGCLSSEKGSPLKWKNLLPLWTYFLLLVYGHFHKRLDVQERKQEVAGKQNETKTKKLKQHADNQSKVSIFIKVAADRQRMSYFYCEYTGSCLSLKMHAVQNAAFDYNISSSCYPPPLP